MEKIFEHKVAIVTGGLFGIGKSTALAFAKRGARVVIADWIQDDAVLKDINEVGGAAIFIRCDVSRSADVAAMVAQAVNVFERIDFAVNNAGIEGQTASSHECTEENWNK